MTDRYLVEKKLRKIEQFLREIVSADTPRDFDAFDPIHASDLFDAIANAFNTVFQIFKTSTLVQNVLGTGPIPSFASYRMKNVFIWYGADFALFMT